MRRAEPARGRDGKVSPGKFVEIAFSEEWNRLVGAIADPTGNGPAGREIQTSLLLLTVRLGSEGTKKKRVTGCPTT